MLTQIDDVDASLVCDNSTSDKKHCFGDLCYCTHVLKFKLGQVVELMMVSEGNDSMVGTVGHPMHIHGGNFRVLASGKVKTNLLC